MLSCCLEYAFCQFYGPAPVPDDANAKFYGMFCWFGIRLYGSAAAPDDVNCKLYGSAAGAEFMSPAFAPTAGALSGFSQEGCIIWI